jgi:hypothetical protein
MKKFFKGAGWYFPADNTLAIDTASDTDNAIVYVADEAGTATASAYTATGTASAAEAYIWAEALIEEINFGKQVVISLADVATETDGTAFAITKSA